MKTKVIIILAMFFTSCLAAAPTPSEVNAVLSRYTKNPKNWSALNYAIEVNDFKSALVLVDYVMDFNRIDDGYSALSRALLHYGQKTHIPNKYKVKFIKKLIKKGADLKRAPLFIACQIGNEEIVKAMLDTGVNISEFNDSAFGQAVYCGKIDIVRLLIGKGVDVKVGYPLWSAFRGHNSEDRYTMVELLLKAGATPNENTGSQHTPYLLYAIGDVKLMTLLLEHGANPNAKVPADRGTSILGIALEYLNHSREGDNSQAYEETVQLLLKYGAKLV